MKKIIFSKFIIVVLFLLGLFCFTACDSDSNKQKITVAQYGDVFIYLPVYLAQEKGFFQEQGLDVNIINTGGDDKTYAAVIGGSAQFGIADPTFAAIAAEKGGKGRVVASIVNGVPFWGITFNNNIKTIHSPQELKNISIATFPSPSTAYALQYQMFKQAGLEPKIKQATIGTLIPMLKTGKADIALELEPNVSTAVKDGAHIAFSMADQYGEFAFTGVTVNESLIQENPALIQKFVNAITKALQYAHDHPAEAIQFAQHKYNNIDPLIMQEATKRMIASGSLPKNAVISDSSWEKALKIRNDLGELNSVKNAMKILDMSYAQNAINKMKGQTYEYNN